MLKKEKKATFSKTTIIGEKKSILPSISGISIVDCYITSSLLNFVYISGTSKDETRFLRNILRKISEKSLFLIESKLTKIMETNPMSEVEKCLVRIDNILQALRITNIDDVNSLTEYFKPYSWCPTCSRGVQQNMITKLFSFDTENYAIGVDTLASSSDSINEASFEKSDPVNIIQEDESISDMVQFSDLDEDVNKMLTGIQTVQLPDGDKSEVEKRRHTKEKVCPNHFLVIEPALVLTALREFTEKHMYRSTTGSEYVLFLISLFFLRFMLFQNSLCTVEKYERRSGKNY